MPKKVRQLKSILQRAGFVIIPGQGKGSHSVWKHTKYPDIIVGLSGNDGADAQLYHERRIIAVLREVEFRNRSGQ